MGDKLFESEYFDVEIVRFDKKLAEKNVKENGANLTSKETNRNGKEE